MKTWSTVSSYIKSNYVFCAEGNFCGPVSLLPESFLMQLFLKTMSHTFKIRLEVEERDYCPAACSLVIRKSWFI